MDEVQMFAETDPFAVEIARPLTASGGPAFPPRSWFGDPGLSQLTPLEVTPEGRVYGHLAGWNTRHVGLPGNVKPPRSRSNYGYFRTGQIQCDDGSRVPIGNLTLVGGHAPLTADAQRAIQHYDNTQSCVADLAAGEDRHGIWVAGATRPEITDTQIRALLASVPSGDWRPVNGALELIAICQVNSGGFPTARAIVASGECVALVASGASDMYRLRMSNFLGEGDTHDRLEHLEAMVASIHHAQTKAELRARVNRSR